MIRTVLLSLSALTVLGSAAADKTGELPLGPGSNVYWTSSYDGGSDTFSEKAIAEGSDFIIYKTNNDYPSGDASDFFALFSGIYYTTCDSELPDAEAREKIASLLPLTEGQTVEVATDGGAKIVVGAETEYYLMGKTWPAHAVRFTYSSEDQTSEEDLIVLNDVPLTVSIRWDDESIDKATLVTRPKTGFESDLGEDVIGNCASLLTDETQ